jgi:hypothetical protein
MRMRFSLVFGIDNVMDALDPLMRMTVPYQDVSPGFQSFDLIMHDGLK